MKNLKNYFKNVDWSRMMFLVPILFAAYISISHVISWYELANPYNWAIYLSIAIEVGAMTALVAANKKIESGVWFMFGLVTAIQFIGNIFYCYKEIVPTDTDFLLWVELTSPIFETFGTEATDIVPHKRWLALLEGGTLPLISLTSLHFFIKYGKRDDSNGDVITEETPPPNNNNQPDKPKESPKIDKKPSKNEPKVDEDLDNEPEIEDTIDYSLVEEVKPEEDVIEIPIEKTEEKKHEELKKGMAKLSKEAISKSLNKPPVEEEIVIENTDNQQSAKKKEMDNQKREEEDDTLGLRRVLSDKTGKTILTYKKPR